jgi:hypothetical protein
MNVLIEVTTEKVFHFYAPNWIVTIKVKNNRIFTT